MRRLLLSAAKIMVSVALLYLALPKTSFSDLAAHLGVGSIGWLGLAIALTLFQVYVSGLRWREVSADCGAPLSTATAARYYLIGSFFNQTLPSAIGGDAMRLWLLARRGAGWRAATYSVFVDRAIGLIALAVLIAVTLPWSFDLISSRNGRVALIVVDVIALGAGAGFLTLGRIRWSWLRTWWGTAHFYTCSEVTNRVLFDRRRGPWIAVLSFAIHIIAVVIAWCVARAIGASVSFWPIFAIVPPVMLITMLPISIAGWGVREASMGLAFGYAGLSSADGVNLSLLYGAVFFVVGAIGGLAWIASAEKAERTRSRDHHDMQVEP